MRAAMRADGMRQATVMPARRSFIRCRSRHVPRRATVVPLPLQAGDACSRFTGNADVTEAAMRVFCLGVLGAMFCAAAAAADTEFEGTPGTKVEVTLGAVSSEKVPKGEALQHRVLITREGDQYFWASRNNTPLYRLDSGDYVTYIAATGVGYVRVLNPSKARGRKVTYMEHLTVQLGSVTYFGS
jgi:hypothetical protein